MACDTLALLGFALVLRRDGLNGITWRGTLSQDAAMKEEVDVIQKECAQRLENVRGLRRQRQQSSDKKVQRMVSGPKDATRTWVHIPWGGVSGPKDGTRTRVRVPWGWVSGPKD